MVRYPHTATILSSTDWSVENGKHVKGEKSVTKIKGRFDSVNPGNAFKYDKSGNEIKVQGAFYTKHKPVVGAYRLKIDLQGIDRQIVCWEEYQKHTVIYV